MKKEVLYLTALNKIKQIKKHNNNNKQTHKQTNKQTNKEKLNFKSFSKTLNLNSCYNKHFVAFDSCTFPEKEN